MSEISITEQGNPAKPNGKAGELMLERMGVSHEGVTGWALSQLDLKGDENVLDIGCGGGDALKRMSARITSGRLFGADYSEVSVELSKKNNIIDVESGKMEIVHAEVKNMPFPDSFFDVIYTIESFYFWGNNPESLREVFRVVKENGIFAVIADINGDDELSEECVENIKKFNLFNPTSSEYKNIFETAGFSDVKILKNAYNPWVCVIGKKK